MEKDMLSLSNATVVLVLGLVVTSTFPALGASRVVPSSQTARAQAITQAIGDDGILSPDRARALRECNARIGSFAEHTWGHHRLNVYRACMAERGQAE
jgi:hypothetical protein